MKVKIPDYDTTVEVPDDMPPKEIEKILAENFPRRKATWLDKYLPTVAEYDRIAARELSESYKKIKTAYKDPSAKNVLKGLLGVGQGLAAPAVAIGEGLFKGGIKNPLTAAGVPDPIAEIAGSFGESASYFLPYGAAVKGAMTAEQLLPALSQMSKSQALGRIIKESLVRPPLTPPGRLPAKSKGLEKLYLTDDIFETFTEAGKEAVKKGVQPKKYLEGKRVAQQLIEWTLSGELREMKGVPELLAKYEISDAKFAVKLYEAAHFAGKSLGRLSSIQRELRKVYANNPEVMALLGKYDPMFKEMGHFDKIIDKVYRLESFRRGLLVTQLATSMRNILSQKARVGLGTVDDIFQGLLVGSVGGKGDSLKALGYGLDAATAIINRFRPSQRKQLEAFLKIHSKTLDKLRLFTTPVHETVLGRIGKALNCINRWQEFNFRKLALESKLRQLSRAKGMKFDYTKATTEMLAEGVDYALTMTFAATPKGKRAAQFIRAWSEFPPATMLVNPFPRFAFGNALPFIKDFSPINFLSAFSPKTVAALAQGHPEKFAKAASEATLGTTMLAAALWYRTRPDAQTAKWYQINIGKGRYIDTRAFAPFNFYLFAAETMVNPHRMTAADFTQATIGLNRAAGATGVIVDFLRSRTVEDAALKMSILTGALLNSFTVPLRTFKDIYAHFNPKEAIMRSVREKPLIASPLANVPGISQMLPPLVSPMKPTLPIVEYPLLRQTTGFSVTVKNAMEEELDRLGIESQRIYPRTGVPEADRIISAIMGHNVALLSSITIGTEEYQKKTDLAKKYHLLAYIQRLRKEARQALKNMRPDLDAEIKIEAKPEELEELYRQRYLPNQRID